MTRFRCLTFLTDFGLDDGFVAACHGTAIRIVPDARIIDVTHLIPPGDIRRGAAILAQTVTSMPPAVHVAVVDPGVGTTRRPVAVETGGDEPAVLVGPDNGLLSWAAAELGGASRAFELTNSELWNQPVSRTFHGRDIFMPVGARLLGGLPAHEAGTEFSIADLTTLAPPISRVTAAGAEGEVLSRDRFGNLQLSILAADAAAAGIGIGSELLIRCNRTEFTAPFLPTFGAARAGELIAFADSSGRISLAVSNGSAAERLSLPPGARVQIAIVPAQ